MSKSTQARRRSVLVLDTPEGYRLERVSAPGSAGRKNVGRLLVALAGVAALVLFGHGGRQHQVVQAAGNTDQVIVKFKSNASQSAINALNASNAVQQVDAIPALGLKVYKVPAGKSADTVVAAYKKNPNVQFAEVNALVKPEAVPNDPNFTTAWHLSKIQAPQAWDSAKATGVLIGICDTGVASVADLAPVLRSDLGWNAVDGSANWGPIAGHGTLVAGAAAAATNNATGVAGVAWGAQILPVRITNTSDGTAYVSDAAKCINYAADKGAKVVNLSYRMAGYASIDTAGKYAMSKGAVVTVAAGNDGTNPGWTSSNGFLAVAATDSNDGRPSWSNYGSFVDIAAPGVNVMTTKQDGSFGGSSGTSLASPVAAGVLALILGANPSLSASQAVQVLLSTADDVGAPGVDANSGSGRVNAGRAVAAALEGAPPQPSPTTTPTATSTPSVSVTPTKTATPRPTSTPPSGSDTVPPVIAISSPTALAVVNGSLTIAATASDNVRVTKVSFYVDGVLLKTDTSTPYATSWNTRKASKGAHTIKAVAYDAAGNSGSASLTVNIQ